MKQPWRDAAILAAIYAAGAGAYIVISGQVAADSSVSVEDLHTIELLKGLLFVGVTTALLFVLSHALFRRAWRATTAMERSRAAFLAAQRRATAGLFAATVAHDFNNLLMVLSAGLYELAAPAPAEDRTATLTEMRTALGRASELARRLGVSGRGTAAGQAERTDVGALIGTSVDFLRSHSQMNRCSLDAESDGTVSASVYPALIHQVVANLVINATEAAGSGGRVVVRTKDAGQGTVVIEVHDSGPGVPPELRDRLFDAFYTTRADGVGLGLLSVKLCAEMHSGRVEVASSDLGGACFRVVLAAPVVLAAA